MKTLLLFLLLTTNALASSAIPGLGGGGGGGRLLGYLYYVGINGCTWSGAVGNGWGSFSEDTGCNTPVAVGTPISAPSNKTTKIVVNIPDATKYYRFVATGSIRWDGSESGCAYRFSDGTDASRPVAVTGNTGSTATIEGVIKFSTSGSKTVELQPRGISGGGQATCAISTGTNQHDFTIYVYEHSL